MTSFVCGESELLTFLLYLGSTTPTESDRLGGQLQNLFPWCECMSVGVSDRHVFVISILGWTTSRAFESFELFGSLVSFSFGLLILIASLHLKCSLFYISKSLTIRYLSRYMCHNAICIP